MAFPAVAAASDGERDAVTWKMGTVISSQVPWAKHIRDIIEPAVDQASGGKLRLHWYWGGVLGDENRYIELMRKGELQGMGSSSMGLVAACPEVSVLELPFLFLNWDEVDFVRERMAGPLDEHAQKRGFKLLMLVDQDFDQIYSSRVKLDSVAAFRRARFGSWNGPLEESLLDVLGAPAMSVDVQSALPAFKRQEADAFIAPALWVVWAQLHPVVRYVSPVRVRYSPGGAVVTTTAWQSLDEDFRADYLSRRDALEREFCSRSRRDSQDALRAMLRYGVQLTEMPPAEMERFRAQCRKTWEKNAGVLYPQSLLDEVLALLKEYRQKP
ncbi:MAG: TRAP transporter substrate-binding protein DctP [Desulfatibacillaceae bacterium]